MSHDITPAPEIHPERARLEALVGFSRKRVSRSIARHVSAAQECAAATSALHAATARLDEWIAANPDPQLPLPLSAAPTSKEATL
jgi:hypothetical protein